MVISNAGYVLINRLTMPVAAFILLILIGHHSDVLLGEYALVTTFFFVMQTLPLLGLMPYVMREVARRPESAARHLATVGALSMLGCAAVALVARIGVGAAPYSQAVSDAVAVVGVAIVPGILAFLAEIVLISLHRARAVAVVAIVENLLRLSLSAWCVMQGQSVVALMWVLLGTRSLALVCYLGVLYLQAGVRPCLPSLTLLREIRPLLPVFVLNTVLSVVVSRMDYIVLSLYLSAEALGHYAIAYRMLEIATLSCIAVMTGVFPRLSQVHVAGREKFAAVVRALFPVVLAGSALLAIVGMGFAESYVRLLFSRQYPEPVLLTQLFVLLVMLVGVDGLMSNALLAADRQASDLRALSMGATVYALALVGFVPWWGATGAFCAALVAMSVQFFARLREFQRHVGAALNLSHVLTVLVGAAVCLGCAVIWCDLLGVWAGPVVLLTCITCFPLIALFFGGMGLRHALMMLWQPATIRPLSSLGGVIDHLAEDARAYQKYLDSRSAPEAVQYENFGWHAVVQLRLVHWAYLNEYRLLGRLLRSLSILIFRSDPTSTADAGPGLVFSHPVGAGISGRLGSRVTLGPFSGLGVRGKHDVGAGAGMPVVGNDVVFQYRSGVLGGVRIEDGSTLIPNGLVCSSRDIPRCVS